jgi:hypothetical protein
VRVNAAAVVVVAPATVILALWWGGVGAAVVYLGLNAAVLTVAMASMHRRVLPGELPRWYGRLVLPVAAVAVVGALSRVAMPDTLDVAGRLVWLAATGVLATAVALLAAGGVRRRVLAAAHAWAGR